MKWLHNYKSFGRIRSISKPQIGVQVVVIEPGAIKTHFDQTALTYGKNILSNPASPYLCLYEKSEQFSADMRQNEPGPEAVSQVIQQAIESSCPKTRYLAAIPWTGRLVIRLRDVVWDLVARRMFEVQEPPLPDQSLSSHLSQIL